MLELANNQEMWFTNIQGMITRIRDWDCWSGEPLKTMKSKVGGLKAGALTLYAYYRYVRRFTVIMCDVLSKVPEADDRYWRLAMNLHDELGGSKGPVAAHAKLIGDASHRPQLVSKEAWDKCAFDVDHIEREFVMDFASLSWPLNLFALGPGTESISDLFLDPIEMWSSDALVNLPRVRDYFDAHRPAIEFDHQMEISQVLADELSRMPQKTAQSILMSGQLVAERVAMRHFDAVCMCWRISNSLN